MLCMTSNASIIYYIFRITFKWFENANCVQTAANQRATNNIFAIFDLDSDVLCYIILQTHLLWSCCDSQSVNFVGDNNIVHKVHSVISKFSFYWTMIFSVMAKLPATSYVRMVDIWLIFVQLYPFIEAISYIIPFITYMYS